MSERILLIGGPQWAENSFKSLKELGFEILLTDVNSQCPMRKYSDYFFNISAVDVNSILSAITPFDSIAVAYCGNDFGAKTAHKVNEAITGRKLIDADLDIFIDKHIMKTFFELHDILTANGVRAHFSSIDSMNIDFPAIAKPVAASGAIGVQHLANIQALENYQHEFSGVFDEVLIEEVLRGSQHDVNGYFVEGKFFPAGLSDRFFVDYPLCYPIYGYSPSRLSQAQQQACYDSLKKIGQAAGLVTGPLKSDVFFCEDGVVRTNEVCLRFHGDITSSNILPNTGRWFPLLQYVKELVPGKADVIEQYLADTYFSKQQVVRWDIIHYDPGVFQVLDNKDEILNQSGVIDIILHKKPGQKLTKIRDNRDMLGYFLTCGKDYDACRSKAEEIHRTLKVSTHE